MLDKQSADLKYQADLEYQEYLKKTSNKNIECTQNSIVAEPFKEFKRHIPIDEFVENTFMKNDNGKNMLSLIEPQFILLLGEILTFGSKKYAPGNWKLCEERSRYEDALLRHLYAYLSGEKIDPESRLSHLGHASFGLMALNYFDNLDKTGEQK